jgi:hypothetical protein
LGLFPVPMNSQLHKKSAIIGYSMDEKTQNIRVLRCAAFGLRFDLLLKQRKCR